MFSCNEIGILNIDLNNINLHDSNFEEETRIWNVLLMTTLVVHNIEVLGHFDDECVSSIQWAKGGGGGIGIFWSIRTILVKNYTWRINIIQKSFLNFHAWFYNQNCNTPQLYTIQLILEPHDLKCLARFWAYLLNNY